MINKEINDFLKSTKARIVIMIILLLPFIDLFMNVYTVYSDYWLFPEAYNGFFPADRLYHPSKAAFLSGTSIGHLSQMLFIWMLPVFLLLMYGDSYIRECNAGYECIIATRVKKVSIFASKLLSGFIIGFTVVFLSLTINYLFSWIIFRKGSSFGGMENLTGISNDILSVSLEYPVLTYIIYMIVFSFVAGLYEVFCVSLSFCTKDFKTLYGLTIIVWFVQIMSPFSITYLIQPFIEYGWNKIIPAVIIFLLSVIVAMGLGLYRKIKYEII